MLSRLQSFDNLQASEFAATQVVPTAGHPLRMPGRPWRLRPSTARFVTSPRIGYASRPNRAIDGIGLSPTRFAALPAATGSYHPPLPRLTRDMKLPKFAAAKGYMFAWPLHVNLFEKPVDYSLRSGPPRAANAEAAAEQQAEA